LAKTKTRQPLVGPEIREKSMQPKGPVFTGRGGDIQVNSLFKLRKEIIDMIKRRKDRRWGEERT